MLIFVSFIASGPGYGHKPKKDQELGEQNQCGMIHADTVGTNPVPDSDPNH